MDILFIIEYPSRHLDDILVILDSLLSQTLTLPMIVIQS